LMSAFTVRPNDSTRKITWRNCDKLLNSKSVREPYLDKNGARGGDGGANKAEALEAADPEDEHPVHLGGPGARNPRVRDDPVTVHSVRW